MRSAARSCSSRAGSTRCWTSASARCRSLTGTSLLPLGPRSVSKYEATQPRSWLLVIDGTRWSVILDDGREAACTIQIEADAAWRLLFNALDPDHARAAMRVSGAERLSRPLLGARSVIV